MAERAKHTIKEFPASRLATLDVGYLGLRKHHVKALLEVDVTRARQLLKAYRRRRKTELSFNAWFVKCVSQAVAENRTAHAIRQGRNKLVVFEDVDISLIVEKELGGEKVPLPVVLRQVNEKSFAAIQAEIKAAKEQTVQDTRDYVLGGNPRSRAMRLYLALPQFLRLAAWKFILRRPFLVKQLSGTVVVTSVGMMGIGAGWIIPVSFLPLCFALGAVVKKPGVCQDRVEIREYLHLTVLMDHDVIDGAPAARFVARLTSLLESGYGLDIEEPVN
ncbi:2-oxoacid dehydrogenase/acyltransferase catalytic subunit [Hydrogenispora ethanolica]|uniref:2-oxoacid dehydrogenase/acyltransferase catalytic subunit n=1 Tax=Hydrogenispora ethanolica TaxID=1082276 RepID=A0A4R1RKF6_HYDET|nr:2-oxo acid dehydrogenase subunit E2 [Hydrogenispora ethanolica]TCL66499.1 2-oxoacid dehydrogenase/acyltransferase catalytic subunit [Hydrogenispora ethanolica]